MSVASGSVISHPLENKRILVIEDEKDIADLVALHLRDRYQFVQVCQSGVEGLDLACREPWDILLLDLGLPELDGLEVCRQLRARGNSVPILMLTSRSSEVDYVVGLEMGADDYVSKPFSVVELMSRVKAMLRRAGMSSAGYASSKPEKLEHKGICVELSKRRVEVNGNPIELTAKEFKLLCYFMQYPGEVFSRSVLLDEVWGYGHQGYEHTVNSHINRLRSKIETDPNEPQYLVTVWGVGYKLVD